MQCIACQKKLRKDSSHSPYCSRCWLKFTPEGKAFNSSKTKKFYIPKDVSLKPKCLGCSKVLRSDSNNGGYCFNCWEAWTEEGRQYRCEKVKRSQGKGKNKKTLN